MAWLLKTKGQLVPEKQFKKIYIVISAIIVFKKNTGLIYQNSNNLQMG